MTILTGSRFIAPVFPEFECALLFHITEVEFHLHIRETGCGWAVRRQSEKSGRAVWGNSGERQVIERT